MSFATKLFQFQVFLMEFQCSLQPIMDTAMKNEIDSSIEYDGIDEDDVFYAEIRRQILLLTADDDGDHQETRVLHSVGSRKPGSNRPVGNFSSLQYGNYFSSWDSQNTNSVPARIANLWRNGNGTGVFIPHINKSRRRYTPGRMNKRRAYRPAETKQS